MCMKVLLVDDEPFILQGLSMLIDWNGEGCEIVKTASNGDEAYQYIKNNPVDMIIADIKMPVMTGLELLERIRTEKLSDAYFIILSGYKDFRFAQRAMRYSCMDYLLKPVNRDNLLELLRRAVNEHGILEAVSMPLQKKQAPTAGEIILYKESLDLLVHAVEENDHDAIEYSVDRLFLEIRRSGLQKELLSMNTNYLLYQLLHLAVKQDNTVNQEEILSQIGENIMGTSFSLESRTHLRRFAYEYAGYLQQLRRNISTGVLAEIEREVRENFSQNLTLKDLSRKYYVNSSYLGQIFRKKYGMSFKDYLTTYRITEACRLLLNTDKKINLVAEEVGYHDTDYFISRFIEQKGCTPTKYRRNSGCA